VSAYRANAYKIRHPDLHFKRVEPSWLDTWNCFRGRHWFSGTNVCVNVSETHPEFCLRANHSHELHLCVFCLKVALADEWCYTGHLSHYHVAEPSLFITETRYNHDIMDVLDIIDPYDNR
jgi:hypothetical protein